MVKFGKDKFNSSSSSLQGIGKLLSHFITTVTGCTIPDVGGVPNINYNGAATIDDGSCILQVIGCMDASAGNYDVTANTAGPCSYPGCIDPAFEEYDPNATVDNGSCATVISYGCVDTSTITPGDGYTYPLYLNSGSFTFPCDDINGPGCIGNNTGENCCCEATILGCTDAAANNWDPTANYNYSPGSWWACDYGYAGCTYPTACNYDPGATGDVFGCGYCGDPLADNTDNICDPGYGDAIGACQYCTSASFNTFVSNNEIVVQWTEAPGGWSSSNQAANWYQPGYDPFSMTIVTETVTDASSAYFGNEIPTGLPTNPYALVENYEIRYKAMADYTWSNWIVLDASNVENWQESEYSGGQPSAWFGTIMPSGDWWYNGPEGPGAQTATLLYKIQGLSASTNYEIQFRSKCTTGYSDFPYANNILTTYSSTIGCTDPAACNYDATALYTWKDECDYVNCLILGCTDPLAANYDPTANTDDNSCEACVDGCMEGSAFNYDPLATCDDGSCIPYIYGCTDPLIFNYDPTANFDDGTCCYVAGCPHPEAYNFDAAVPMGCNDGSCNMSTEYLGCIDPTADNYDPSANTAGTIASGDACFPGYQEELYTGVVGDNTNWQGYPGNSILGGIDGAVQLQNISNASNIGDKLYLRQQTGEFSEDLVVGKSYRLEFDARVSDHVNGSANSAAEVFGLVNFANQTNGTTAPITYDGYHTPQLFSSNGYYYQKQSIHFVAVSPDQHRLEVPLDIGEYIWIKNISLKQMNVITNVTSTNYFLSFAGDYFHFDESVMSEMLEVVNDPGNNTWSGTQINVSHWRSGVLYSSLKQVEIYDSSATDSQPSGWSGDIQGFGVIASGGNPGDWQVGDEIRIIV